MRTISGIRIAIFASTLLLGINIAPYLKGQTAPDSSCETVPQGTDATVACIVKIRTLSESYVSIAKSMFPDKTSTKYIEAQKRYADAYSKNSAWQAYVSSALRAGRSRRLNNDEQFKKVTADAATSAKTFISYVDTQQAAPSHAVLTILSSLADLGVKLWTDISKQIDTQRKTAADNFDAQTRWKSWDQLGTESPRTDATAPVNHGSSTTPIVTPKDH